MGKLVDVKLATEYIYDKSTGNYTAQAIQTRITDAGILVTAINPNNLIEDNEKRMYEVIINHFANPESA